MKDWTIYCETTYNSLRANIHNWGKPEFARPITRIYYIGVFDCGVPNPTGLISENALKNKNIKQKVVHDHYLSPQFIGRMILDNPEVYLTDFDKFKSIFWQSCQTIVVTQQENDALAALTSNDGNIYKVQVPTYLKYNHLKIKLNKRPENTIRWNTSVPIESNILEVPEELTQYEKRFLV
jgi:hypothetical protein